MKLDIFDFDGTLVRTPVNTPENIKKYEKATGIPWIIDKNLARELSNKHGKHIGMRRGWFGRAETLEPPLVPDPCPRSLGITEVIDQFHESKRNKNTRTLIVTGRHAGLKSQVLRICGDLGLISVRRKKSEKEKLFVENLDKDVTLYCLGDDGPGKCKTTPTKPNETFPWKMWLIEMFAEYYPELEEIEIWEDRQEHFLNFQTQIPEKIPHPFKVNLVSG